MADDGKAFVLNSSKSFESLKKYEKPRHSFKETASLHEVLTLTENYPTEKGPTEHGPTENGLTENYPTENGPTENGPTEDYPTENGQNKYYPVVHLYGMSGSGKSQLVAAVCQKRDENPGRIIWHVQCQETAGKLKREWKHFAGELQKIGLISPAEEFTMSIAISDATEIEIKKFLNIINRLDLAVPIIFAIEDIADEDEKDVVVTLINCMKDINKGVLNVRLLIATQEKEALYPKIDLDSLDIYKTYNVRGFTGEEALQFLSTPELRITNESKVRKLAAELAYSPLGLCVVKSYCQKFKQSYEDYYDSLGKHEDVNEERKLMKADNMLKGKQHRYDIIVKLLSPFKGGNEEHADEDIQWKVMLMMSFVSNEHIPVQLLNKFFEVAGSMDVCKQRKATRNLFERLKREVDAQVWGEKVDAKGGDDNELLNVHGDVLRALNRSMKDEERKKVLVDVVMALASLLSKDNRIMKDYRLLHALKNHAEVVAKHTANHFAGLLTTTKARVDDYELLLGLSKIYEVIGFAISQHPGFRENNDEDEYYKRAMECIWVLVRSNIGGNLLSFLPSWLTKQKKKEEKAKVLIDYEPGKDPKATAKKVFELMKKASLANDVMKEALQNDWERLYQVKEMNLKDMEKHLAEGCTVDWNGMKKELCENGCLSTKSKGELVAQKMIIDWEKLIEFYLAERLGSILHSRGRQDNYKGDIISQEMHTRCIWYVDLGFQLCDIAGKKTGVKSLFHYILRANNKLPRSVRNKEKESDEQFLMRINESLKVARSLEKEKSDFYEHGIYKLISGTPWTRMNALKYLVKANTKVYKRPTVAKDFPTSESDKECEELCELCQNNPDIVISTTCLIHAGKYFGARKEYTKALDVFDSAFSHGIDKKNQTNPTTYSWALYNTGRAISAAGRGLEDRPNRIKTFNRRYELVMNTDGVPEKWKKLLDACKTELDKPI